MDKGISSNKASMILFFTALVWGTGFIGCQYALDYGFTPLQIISFRMAVGAVCLNIAFYKKLSTFTKAEVIAGIKIGFCLFFAFSFQMYGLKYSTPSVNAFLTAVYVILIPFIMYLRTKERPDIFSNVSAVMTVVGISLISVTGELTMSLGAALTLICAVLYAFQLIYTEEYVKIYDPVKITIVMLNLASLLGLVSTGISALIFNNLPSYTTEGTISIIYLGLACTFFCFLMQNIGQKYTTAVRAAILLSLESVFCAIFSAIIFKEVFTAQMVGGCVLIFAAVIISETKLSFIFNGKVKEAKL